MEWVALMYGLLSPGGWFLLTLSVITRPRTHYPAQSELMAESGPACRQEQTRAQGKQVECQLSSQYSSDCGIVECWLIAQRYPPVDLPASVLLLSSLLLVCEALRFPRDCSPDVTNDYDDADNRIDDDVPDELQMATKIDVRDTQQLRGEI